MVLVASVKVNLSFFIPETLSIGATCMEVFITFNGYKSAPETTPERPPLKNLIAVAVLNFDGESIYLVDN